MIISIKEILDRELVKRRDFGGGEGPVEPEGAAVDVRLGEIWRVVAGSKGFLKIKTRETRKYELVSKYKPGHSTTFTLEPMVYYQFKSVEIIDVPMDVVARFCARFNLLVNGILICAYKADPGFKGEFVVPIINLSGVPFEIEMGSRWGQFEFHRIDGEAVKYRGQWRNGRVYTKKEEDQV